MPILGSLLRQAQHMPFRPEFSLEKSLFIPDKRAFSSQNQNENKRPKKLHLFIQHSLQAPGFKKFPLPGKK